MRSLVAALLAFGFAACVSPPRTVPALATAQIVSDFDTYTIRRVGLVPFSGDGLSSDESSELQSALLAELETATPYEVVKLAGSDLAEVPSMEPHRRGWYRPKTILEVSNRYSLDAILIGTVTDRSPYPPQRLGLQVDMVAAETGLPIWSASVHLDASQDRVKRSLEVWAEDHLGGPNDGDWHLFLVSPRRFARFAAFQVAALI